MRKPQASEAVKQKKHSIRQKIYKGSASPEEVRWYEANRDPRGRRPRQAAPGASQAAPTSSPPAMEGGVFSASPVASESAESSPGSGPPPIDLVDEAPKTKASAPLIVSESSALLASAVVGALRACNQYNRQHGGFALPDEVRVSQSHYLSPWPAIEQAWGRVIERYLPSVDSEEADLYIVGGSSAAIVGQAGWLYFAGPKSPTPTAPSSASPPAPEGPPSNGVHVETVPDSPPPAESTMSRELMRAGGLWKT